VIAIVASRARRGHGDASAAHPRWLVALTASVTTGSLMALVGFYWDVSKHVDFGRDGGLFVSAHLLIVISQQLTVLGAALAILLATADRSPTDLRVGRLRVPRAALLIAMLSTGAVVGLPLDGVWHAWFGEDVTLWSPTHLMMLGSSALRPLALWLGFAEAARLGGRRHVEPSWVVVFLGGCSLVSLSTFQAEFDFGIPQFPAPYHPVLVVAAAAFVLTAVRAASHPGAALLAALMFVVVRLGVVAFLDHVVDRTVAVMPLYLGTALAVEAGALVRPPIRRAVVTGAGCATLGLLAEWPWVGRTFELPWDASLLAATAPLAVLMGVSAAVLGVAWGSALADRPALPPWAVATASVGVVAALALPASTVAPSDATAEVEVAVDGGQAIVTVTPGAGLGPAGAWWFHALGWRSGEREVVPLRPAADGASFVTDRPIRAAPGMRLVLRYHEGRTMGAAPVPLDLALDQGRGRRTVAFVADRELLLEGHRVTGLLRPLAVVALLLAMVGSCLAATVVSAARLGRSPTRDDVSRRSSDGSDRTDPGHQPTARPGPRPVRREPDPCA
jgi:hypothetical protein